jgi:hypothetical protein
MREEGRPLKRIETGYYGRKGKFPLCEWAFLPQSRYTVQRAIVGLQSSRNASWVDYGEVDVNKGNTGIVK